MIKHFGFVLFFVLFSFAALASDLSEIKKDLIVIQSRIELERARYQEAKAKMERSELVAKYLLPELKARENDLKKKIRNLEKQKLGNYKLREDK